MKRFEAPTLKEACDLATKEYNCSIEDMEYKIVQYPKKGFLGLFSKNAIIEIIKVNCSKEEPTEFESTKIEESNDTKIVDSFFTPKEEKKESISAAELESKIKTLMDKSCFDIDTVEVDIKDNTAYVFLDGEDAALLIGKEGYRYNALSYILFNWINAKYGLFLKLEIAEFFSSQKEMVINLLQPVVEHVKKVGWGKTKPLDGILIQIALEYLREQFPNKYVAIKRQNNQKYIIINDFNKRYE
ncbi:MAG: protein jag [Epsilonproteobacteria bacterium]|nr:protein jag [Campylobacterota bacterium]